MIDGLIDRLENHYQFECEGGPLKNCVEWRKLKAAIPSQQADDWRDIGSAPKDGTNILGMWVDAQDAGQQFHYSIATCINGMWCSPENVEEEWNAPTYWQPLPTPPAPEGEGGAATSSYGGASDPENVLSGVRVLQIVENEINEAGTYWAQTMSGLSAEQLSEYLTNSLFQNICEAVDKATPSPAGTASGGIVEPPPLLVRAVLHCIQTWGKQHTDEELADGIARTLTKLGYATPAPQPGPEVVELREALRRSVALQSHYALILNDYDGGERLQFKSEQEWLERLSVLRTLPRREGRMSGGTRYRVQGETVRGEPRMYWVADSEQNWKVVSDYTRDMRQAERWVEKLTAARTPKPGETK